MNSKNNVIPDGGVGGSVAAKHLRKRLSLQHRVTMRVVASLVLLFPGGSFTSRAEAGRSRGLSSVQPSVESQEAGPSSLSSSDLIQPEELANRLKSTRDPKPLILQVGFRVLYLQAHIPGAEYIGAGSRADGIQQLRKRVESLSRTRAIVLYCGCCPWNNCPNLIPAHKELVRLGFRNLKLLYIADNFGKDWVEKGYPVEKGE